MSPSELAAWLREEAARQIAGCRKMSDNGRAPIFCPDGHGGYNALWTRDFCYMVEGCGEAIDDSDLWHATAFLATKVVDALVPDRVQADGLAIYCAGSLTNPVAGPPTDNGPFFVKLVGHMVGRVGGGDLKQALPILERVLAKVPRDDALVTIAPDGPPLSPYGFTDCIAKTGDVLFDSLLFWEACGAMTRLYLVYGMADFAARWAGEATRVRAALDAFWDDEQGILLAATKACRQPDVWGSAYAVYLGVLDGARAERVGEWLKAHYDTLVQHGMVRHVVEPEGWQAMLRDVPLGTYQNGGYWPVPTAWVCHALARVDRRLARQTLLDLLTWMHEHGVNEWEHPDGGVGARDYVASACLPLLAVDLLADD